MRNKFILSLALLCILFNASAQVGIGTITPDASSSLEILSTTKGFLMPRMTSGQRGAIPSPATGLLVFQTDAPAGFWYYTGTQWVRLVSSADASLNISTAFAANTAGSTIAVVLAGTDIPFPNSQILPTGYSINGANTTLTLANAGRYRISYNLTTTLGLIVGTRVMLNGTAIPASVSAPLLSTSFFSKEAIVDVTAGSTLSLQFYGLLGAAVLSGAANFSVIRLN